jgi:hypothetical protein
MMLDQQSDESGFFRRHVMPTLSPRAGVCADGRGDRPRAVASGTPSPLYGTYRALFSLPPIMVTLVCGSLSVPAILAGALATPLGLNSTFEILGALFVAVAVVVASLGFRSRPEPATSRTCTTAYARQTAGTAVLDLT